MKYIQQVNLVKDYISDVIASAGIKNLNGVALNIFSHGVPKSFSVNDCPACAIVKRMASGEHHETDQPGLWLPSTVMLRLLLVDVSMVDLRSAEASTDDLIDSILETLSPHASLSGYGYGIRVSAITWNEERIEGMYYSEPVIDLEVILSY